MDDRRLHTRLAFKTSVKLMHPVIGEQTVEMQDMSDGGAFLLVANHEDLPIGALVHIQALGIEDAPVVSARVVRHDPSGIGLKYMTD